MPLTIGTRLGPYEVVAPLGAGGMGEVYRAKDLELGRFVAVKVLPSQLADNAAALARFEREAKAVAALSHANILSIFNFGRQGETAYAVMELLEGETLRTKLAAPVPIRKAIDYAIQIARGLAAAHDRGIAHRDLKPENLFVTTDGRVKILDFGLARRTVAVAAAADATASPTIEPHTDPGTVLGTVGYMSPEQARGEPGDQRSDIFSLGAVLYELVSGRRAFQRDTAAETMTAILREDPPALTTSSSPGVPPGLVRLIDHCLEKNAAERFQSASDAAFALEHLSGTSLSTADTVAAVRLPRTWVPWSLVALLAIALGALLALGFRGPVAPDLVTRLSVGLPKAIPVASLGAPSRTLAISPDGRRIIYAGQTGPGRIQLFVRALDELTVAPIQGTDGARQPFFSPDGRWIAFFTVAGELKKAPLDGGPPVTIARDLLNSQWAFGVWRPDDVIVFSLTENLRQVPASGGPVTDLTTLDPVKERALHQFPQLVPETGDILFTVVAIDGPGRLEILRWDTRARSTVLENMGTGAVLTSSGHLLFIRDNALMAAAFDARRRTAGPLTALPESVGIDSELSTTAQLAVSQTGTLAYVPASRVEAPAVGWVNRAGAFEEVATLPGRSEGTALSPDGRTAAILAGNQLLLYDLLRRVPTLIDFKRRLDRDSIGWHSDGERITLGGVSLTLFDPDSGKNTPLTERGRFKRFPSWSPDGRTVVYATLDPTWDIHVLSLDGDVKPRALIATETSETAPAISPDGQWMAFTSAEVNGRTNVYVVRFPAATGRTQITDAGGGRPLWSHDGRELFFGAPPGVLKAVSIAPGDTLQVGAARTLFPLDNLRIVGVSRDGRFLALREPPVDPPIEIVVVQNWLQALTRLVPQL